MTTLTQDTYLAVMFVVLVGLAASALVFRSALRLRHEVRRDQLKYRFFAARDKLYLCAADGLIETDSRVFLDLRESINFLICESDEAGVNEFLSVVDEKGEPGPVAQLSPEAAGAVAEIIADVSATLLEYFRYNSRLVRFFMWVKRVHPVRQDISADLTRVEAGYRTIAAGQTPKHAMPSQRPSLSPAL